MTVALAIGMANLVIAPVVNAKVYRHFAAVTFAITLCVALFANGEAHQVADDNISEQQQKAKLRKADAKKFGAKRIGDRRSGIGTSSGFGDDFDPGYGAASNSGGSRPTTYSHGDYADIGSSDPESTQPLAILSPDEVAELSTEEQTAYVKRLRNQGGEQREEVVRDLASIEAGSRARSGSAASD